MLTWQPTQTTSHPAGRLPTRENKHTGTETPCGLALWKWVHRCPEIQHLCSHFYTPVGSPQPSSPSPSEEVHNLAEILLVKKREQGKHAGQFPYSSQEPTSLALAEMDVGDPLKSFHRSFI